MKILDGFLPFESQLMNGKTNKNPVADEEYKIFAAFSNLLTQQLTQTEEELVNNEQVELHLIIDDIAEVITKGLPEIDLEKLEEISYKVFPNQENVEKFIEDIKVLVSEVTHSGDSTLEKLNSQNIEDLVKNLIQGEMKESFSKPEQKFYSKNNYYDPKNEISVKTGNEKVVDLNNFRINNGNQSLFYGKNNNGTDLVANMSKEFPLDNEEIQLNEKFQPLTVDPNIRVNMEKLDMVTTNNLIQVPIEELGESILQLAYKNMNILKKGELTTGTMRLYPEELGQVTIELEMLKGDLSVRIVASNEAAFNHLQQNAKDLIQKFVEEGTYTEVSVDLNMGDTSQDTRDQNFQNHFALTSKSQQKQATDEEIIQYFETDKGNYNYKV
ncbi:flagellar hook-length control protein FliK [Alkalicella caledoniensis]|uniref:Flagellar hook-length control protein FliK n=1 Tax=Alkalicella caledoniensis TaxID=2731377 RepID=A0A7G9WCK9_ALKCA|nr:flagellar hook-length control protein FliK [Alkalicella caledoniensis]QNO16421.1 flagellar hook-length control protein FliK [Alkalicella caledoniensis]